MSIEKNHIEFKKSKSVLEKLSLAYKNTIIQSECIEKAKEEICKMADELGYMIDKNNGKLIPKN